jgi:AbrB family looped-hinge helix DNA binding protein
MSITARIAPKYQVTIPRVVREDVGLNVGDYITFIKAPDGSWKIQAIPRDPILALRLAGKDLPPADWRELHAEYETGWGDERRT